MSGVLGVLLGSSSVIASTFNITAGSITSPAGAGYNDGTAGTQGTAAGSITGGTLSGAKHICEIESVLGPNDLLFVKGFTADPGQGWVVSLYFPVTSNVGPPVTLQGSAATYSYDSVNGVAKWTWAGQLGILTGNTYSNNVLTHYS